jgi:acyl carrier protein
MDLNDRIREILRQSLQLGQRADRLTPESGLLGSLPEFESMAVVTVLTMIEEEFDLTIADDEVSAEDFQTLGSLTRLVSGKLRS